MATKFLDKSGLSYFWTKIKSYVAGLLALKADDGNVVHKTGNEGISGTKTFSSQIVGTIGKSVGDGQYVDMVQTYQSDNGVNRSCTIRCTNGDGFNELGLGVHDEVNGAPRGLWLRSTAGTLTGEFNGSLHLTRTVDVQGTEDKDPALSIGTSSGVHLELDPNEIMAKASGTTTGALFLNADGGDVYIGGNTDNYKSVTGRGKGSSTVPVYTNASGIVTACGSSLDVDVSGNASTATKLLPQPNTSMPTGNLTEDGLQLIEVTLSNTGYPCNYGNVLNAQGSVKKGAGQLLLGWSGITNGIEHLYYRNKRDAASTWSDWKTIAFTSDDITGNAATATKLATPRTINGVSFDGSADITVADSTKVAKSGDTMTGTLYVQPSSVNISVEPSALKEDYRFAISKNSADTTHNGNLMRLGVSQAANTKDYRILLGVSNPRSGNLPTSASIAGGTDDSDASTSSCWGSIGLLYDYSKNKAFPVLFGCSAYPANDNSSTSLATTAWIRTATGSFACNAATATAFASSQTVELTGAVTGTASSTGGWTVSTLWRYCQLGRSDSGSSNPWYKVASRRLGGATVSYSIAFFVENCNTPHKFSGILRMSVSTDTNGMISSGNAIFRWVANDGFSPEDFVLVCPDTASPTVEIWARFAAGYLRRRFTVISEGTQNGASISWTLYNTVSAGQEASIPTAGTQVVSSASLLEQRVKALEDAMQ